MALSPRDSGKYIAAHASHVEINEYGVERLAHIIADKIKFDSFSTRRFIDDPYHPGHDDPLALDWILVVQSMNFCFWSLDGETHRWLVDWKAGYLALSVCVYRALTNHPKLFDPKYYSNITDEELGEVLESDNGEPIPLLSERANCLREVGTVLVEKFDGSFKNLVEQANGSAKKLLNIIVNNFECFRDEAEYNGKKVSFYTRAQILIGDIWDCFKYEGIGYFDDIDELTMSASYRVPQAMVYCDALIYTDELLEKLKNDTPLPNGSEEEVEIRGCSIHVVEMIKDKMYSILPEMEVNAIQIDRCLFYYRRDKNRVIKKKKIPFHKTVSIYY